MHSSSLLLLISLTLTFLTFNVESRTCVCAFFTEDSCVKNGCIWNDVRPTSNKNNQGSKGKCRSLAYMKCKLDPECTLAANDPRFRNDTTTAPTPSTTSPPFAGLHAHAAIKDDGFYDNRTGDYWNNETATENCTDNNANCDWPYDCISGVFHKYAIDVTVFELAAMKMDKYEREYAHLINADGDGFKLEENNSVESSVYESLTGLQIFAGISFIIILVCAMIYYQCKRDDGKYIPLATMDGSAYATFDDEV